VSEASDTGRGPASIAFIVGAGTIFTGVAFRFHPARSSAFEPRLGARYVVLAIALGAISLALAWLSRPRKDTWVMLGLVPIAGAGGVAMAALALLEPIVRDHLVPAGLEAAGGFTVIAAALRWFWAHRVRELAPLGPTKKRKVRLRKRGDDSKKVEVAIDSLLPGDEVELQPGEDLPVDGTIVSGSGFVDESILTGPALPSAKKPGDVLLAGTTPTIPDLVVRVGAEPGSSLLAQREQLASDVREELALAGTTGRLAALAVTLLGFAAVGLILVQADLSILERWMPQVAGLALASVAGAPALALMSGRMATLLLARKSGMIVAREKDVRALSSVRRWQIDPRLLAAPGEVEIVAFGDDSNDRLLAVTEALIASELGPELPSIQAVLKKRKIAPLAAAALRRSQSVYHGTVDGERWFLGPQRAVEEEEKATIDPSSATTLEFLREKGLITWLIGKYDEGIVGAVGIGISAKAEVKTTAQKLGATVMPGFPDATRQAIAAAAGIACDGPPLARTDGTLLYESSQPPSTGFRVRVMRPRPGLELRSDRAPRILEPAVASFADLVQAAKRVGLRARVRAVMLAILPVALAIALFELGPLSPLTGTGIALFTLLMANRG
jgi:cation transport ATPase